MGLFDNIEKKIADSVVGAFSKANSVETAVVNEVQKIEHAILGEVKTVFDQAREDALAANELVNKLKADLQTALTEAAELHQTAVDAANAARAAAEADVEKYKTLAAAHAADLATQAGQIQAAPVLTVDPAPAQ
jgi:hypothetical protein